MKRNKNKNPIQIETDEWWYKGCFIQEQIHPELLKYHVFKDTIEQETIGTTNSFVRAKEMCVDNEVKDYKIGWRSFLF